MKKITLLLLALFAFTGNTLFASHLMGGEITWTCGGASNQQYVFHVKLYRDCNGIPGPSSVTLSTDAPGLSAGILCYLVSQTDISPVCNTSGPSITCAGATGNTAGAVQELTYQSQPITLSGVPPAAGWVFWYSDCCRTVAIVNLASSSVGFTLRAKMFAYNGTNANVCYDNSPQFAELPKTIICTGYPFVINHNAKDAELDSLTYDWDHPIDQVPTGSIWTQTNLAYNNPYTYDNPLPQPSQNPNNVAAVLNHNTGEVSFTSFIAGAYVFVLKVTEYRCGQKIAEIFRDFYVVLAPCADIVPGFPNHPPVNTAPFMDSFGLYTSYTDTVHAGDTVSFSMTATDPDAAHQLQNITLTASGLEFDSAFTNSNGSCPFPPCATLSPSPIGFSSLVNATFNFNWRTPPCTPFQDGICSTNSKEYFFNFSFYDDFCPIPARSYKVVKIVVIGDSVPTIYQSGDTLYSSVQSSYYQWFMNGSLITGATSNYYVPTQNGFYIVETTFTNGCTTNSPRFPFTNTLVISPDNIAELDISPNPFHQSVRVHVAGNKLNDANIILRDITGRTLSSWKYNSLSSVLDEAYDLSDLSAGIYLMQIKIGGAQKTFKLVKE